MSGNVNEDTKPFLGRCLVVVFKEKKQRKSGENAEDFHEPNKDTEINRGESDNCGLYNLNVKGATTENARENTQEKSKNGKDLYEELVSQNRGCFWNPHLEESLNNIQVLGYVYPHTLLLGGRDIYLDTIRGAWSRRILQAPHSFTIHKIGEISHVNMQVTSQAQFTPLPEALCMIISDLNKLNSLATFEEIIKQLKKKYKGVHQPAEEIVYEALGTLLKERKVYHTGRGYHIITPELFAHLNHLNGCATLQDNQNSIFIPLPHSQTTEMCSIAIQTDDIQPDIVLDRTDKEEKNYKMKKFERSNSLKESKKTSKEKKLSSESFTRSASMRLADDKGKNVIRDINLKTSDLHTDKEKGEKSSIFSKIFGSKSKKKQCPISLEEDEQDDSVCAIQQTSVQYATFSAQFPPPDIQWYETQAKAAALFKESAVNSSHLSKSGTFHYLQKPSMVDAEAQSDIFDDTDIDLCPVHKSKTLPENISGLASAMQSHRWQQSSSSHSQESKHSQGEFPNNSKGFSKSKHRTKSKKHRKHREKRRSRQLVETIHHVGENHVEDLTYVDHTSSDNYGKPANNHGTSKYLKSSPQYINNSDAIYEDIGEYQKPLNNEQDFPDEVYVDPTSAKINHSPSSDNSGLIKHNNHQPVNPVKNSSHKNKIYKKYKEMYSQCTTSCNNDVSLEYNAHLPANTLPIAKSCDSGVNCIGLPELQPCVTVPLSEVSNSLNYSIDTEQPLVMTQPQMYNIAQSKLNNIHNDSHSRSHSADAVNQNSSNVLVHKAEVYRPVDPKINHSNIYEDSGINSPKGPFTMYSPNYNSFNQQKPDLLQNYHHNFNRNVFKEQSKDLSNSFVQYKGYNPPVLKDCGEYLETDLDHPHLDKSRLEREGSPSQMQDQHRGFHLLSPEDQPENEHLERRPKHSSKVNRFDRHHKHHSHSREFHEQSQPMKNNSKYQTSVTRNPDCVSSDRQLSSHSPHIKGKSNDFEVVGVM